MKICGIICELNPAHNGHEELLKKVKEKTQCDIFIAIMSPNYVQRGEPAIYDYKIRAQMAINIGFDAVIYMPTSYTINSANKFAEYGVKIADQLNVDFLAFGTNLTIDELIDIKQQTTSKMFIDLLKSYLSNGLSYSNAFSKALYSISNKKLKANDILALEYLSAIDKIDSRMKPIAIIRDNNFSSTELRKLLLKNELKKTKDMVNNKNYEIMLNNKINDYNSFNNCIYYNIISKPLIELSKIKDMKEGLENKIFETNANNLEELIDKIKSKRYNKNYIQRLFLNILFNNKINDIDNLNYLKVVAVKNVSVLKYLHSILPILTNLKNKNILQEKSVYDVDVISNKIYYEINHVHQSRFPYQKMIIHNK